MRTEVELTDTDMAYLTSLSCHDRAEVTIVATFRAIMGAETWDKAESIRPGDFAIPKAQWFALCDSNSHAGDSMQWVNVGPAAYDEGGAE